MGLLNVKLTGLAKRFAARAKWHAREVHKDSPLPVKPPAPAPSIHPTRRRPAQRP